MPHLSFGFTVFALILPVFYICCQQCLRFVFVFSVCSARFNKCYVLLDELNQRYNNTQTSWHFALTGICEDQGWSLVTFHSKVEQEFVVFMLLNRLNYTNYEYTYIGRFFFFYSHFSNVKLTTEIRR